MSVSSVDECGFLLGVGGGDSSFSVSAFNSLYKTRGRDACAIWAAAPLRGRPDAIVPIAAYYANLSRSKGLEI